MRYVFVCGDITW